MHHNNRGDAGRLVKRRNKSKPEKSPISDFSMRVFPISILAQDSAVVDLWKFEEVY